MIQIIKGTFGYYNGRKVVPVTPADGPQNFDKSLEERLVKQGIAKYVDAPAVSLPDEVEDTAVVDEAKVEYGEVEYNDSMKLTELKAIAHDFFGIDANAMRSKAEVIAAIEAAKAESSADTDDIVDDGEEPPQFNVADPV